MSHYEERLQEDLDRLHTTVKTLGDTVGTAMRNAVRALLENDVELANEVIIGDLAINRSSRDLDRSCHAFVARHLPSAGHLRYVSSLMRMSVMLERIGDYAETISRTVQHIGTRPSETIIKDIEFMADQAFQVYDQSMKAFVAKNPDMAQSTHALSTQFTKTFDKVIVDLSKESESSSRPAHELFALLGTFNRLERTIHQSKNICEETVFFATGKTKSRKKFNVLFVDETGNGPSVLAAAIARRSYPDAGQFASAGWTPAAELDAGFVKFADERGLELEDGNPRKTGSVGFRPDEFDIIIDLNGKARENLSKPGFHTVILVHALGDKTSAEQVFEDVKDYLNDLMLKLRGEEWD